MLTIKGVTLIRLFFHSAVNIVVASNIMGENNLAFLGHLSEQEVRLGALNYLRRLMSLSRGCTEAYRL